MMAKVLDPVFARPRGMLGQLGGRIMARTNVDVERLVVELARLSAGESVLVVGPGPGVGLRLAAEAVGAAAGGRPVTGGGPVIGVEPSATMRAQATERCADLIAAGRIELRDGDAARTGAPDASMHAVISVNNVMFWPDRDAALTELRRVLRPGGRLVVFSHEIGLRVAGIGLDQLRAEAERAGFTGVTVDTHGHASLMGTAVELQAHRP